MKSLAGMAAFVHAVEQRSYVAAGRLLGISSSAVAKSISRLEDDLGVRLLQRSSRQFGLTNEGQTFYERCRRILDDVRDAEAALHDAREVPRGRLRVSVPHLVGTTILLPRLSEFMAAYPEVELDLRLDDALVDIVDDDVDLAIRTGELDDSRLVARRLVDQHFVVCASREYFERHGSPLHPRDLSAHECLHFRFPSTGRLQPWAFRRDLGEVRLPTTMAFDNSDGIRLAVANHLGVGCLPVYVARELTKVVPLQAVLTEFVEPRGSLSVVWPSNRQLSPKVRVFADFVVRSFDEGARLVGRIGSASFA